ncbi:MAG: hypothetical protein LBD56_02005 [Endomicrobium sp.]|jgi:hypothetical protein|nr:hypothetical protein [Endomicrobium sp.]
MLNLERSYILNKVGRVNMKKFIGCFVVLCFMFPSLLRAAERTCIDVKKELASVQSSTITNDTFNEKNKS